MQPDVPPDFLRIVNTAGLHQQFAVVFVLGKRFERVGNASARKTFEHFQSITFQPGVFAHPKRRVDRERVKMGQKIARLIHHVNRHFAVRDTHVHMQTKNEIRTCKQLHVFDDLLVAFAFGDVLVAPVRKGVCADGCDF